MSDRTYRLSPPDRTGVFLGLSMAQCATFGAALLVGVLSARLGAPLVVVPVVLAVAAFVALVPLGGMPLVSWAGPALRWARAGGRSGRTWLAPLGSAGPVGKARPITPPLPPPLDGQELMVAGSGDSEVAVVRDGRARTYAASLGVSGRQFALVERGEQEGLLALWGDALAAFSRERTPVCEVRWTEWAAPAGMEEQHAYIAEHAVPDPDDAAAASYRELLRTAAPVATRHEVLVTVVITETRVRVASRHGGDRAAAACEALCEELRLLTRRLESAGLAVGPPLSPAQWARAVRVRLDPRSIVTLDRRGRSLGDRAGLVDPADGGPMAAVAEWTHWRTDGSFHRAFYFREWPRFEVGPTWMSDLLLYGGAVRTVAMCYQPVSPRASQRAILRQAAKLESDAEQRRRAGFRVGAHHRRAHRAVEEREEELVAGYAEHEYVGLVDVCAPDLESLETACAEVTQVAASCGVELRPLDGRHHEAVAACLPLARGLAPRVLKL